MIVLLFIYNFKDRVLFSIIRRQYGYYIKYYYSLNTLYSIIILNTLLSLFYIHATPGRSTKPGWKHTSGSLALCGS